MITYLYYQLSKTTTDMKKRLCILLYSLLPLFTAAQVTMGSDNTPNPGALLDLKEYKSSNRITAKKGLLLPRVALTDLSKLAPMFKYDDPANEPTDKDMQEHTGLIVFNVNETENKDTCPTGIASGIYVWNSQEWVPLNQENGGDYRQERLEDADTFVDRRDPDNPITYRIGYFEDAGWWMLENLRADRLPDGTLIERSIVNDYVYKMNYNYPVVAPSSGQVVANPTADLVNRNPEYGYMYSWLAATGGKKVLEDIDDSASDKGVQGICPEGWHLPSKKEWLALYSEIKICEDHEICVYATEPLLDDEVEESRAFIALLSADKLEGAEHLEYPTKGKSVSHEEGGFNFLPTGICSGAGYYQYGNFTRAWSSSRKDAKTAYMAAFNLSNIESYKSDNNVTPWSASALIPVRCKKN